MELTIGSVPLTGTVPEESVADFVSVPDTQVQVAGFLRADSAAIFERGNTKRVVTFTISRTYARAEDAAYACASHEALFPRQALFTYTTDDGTLYLANAVAEVTRSTFAGCYTTHSYRVTGGAWLTKRPTVTT